MIWLFGVLRHIGIMLADIRIYVIEKYTPRLKTMISLYLNQSNLWRANSKID